MTEQESRFTDPDTAVDHVRRVARETATASGHRAAAFAVMDLRREYRILPLQQKKVATDRLATWQGGADGDQVAGADGDGRHDGPGAVRRAGSDAGGPPAPPTTGLGARPVAGPAGGCAARNGARVTASPAGPLAGSRHRQDSAA